MQFTVFLNITRSRTVALFFFVLVSSGSSHSESSFTESNVSENEKSLELIGRRVRDETHSKLHNYEHSHNSIFGEESSLGNIVLSPVASDEERGIRSSMGLDGLMCGDAP